MAENNVNLEVDDSSSRSASPETAKEASEEMESVESQSQSPKVVDEELNTTMTGASGSGGGATASASAVNSIEKLLQQQRNEIMFELRRLQLGERPVTGQGNKEAVENFFTARINGQDPEERERPENVVVEVNALVERRPVSSLLQSNRFRRSLENALRSAITTVSPSNQSQGSFLNRQQQQQQRASPAPQRSNSPAPSTLNLPRPLRYASPAPSTHSSQESVPSFTSTPAFPGPPPPFPGEMAPVPVPEGRGVAPPAPPPPPPAPGVTAAGPPSQEQVTPWLQQHIEQGAADGVPLTWAQLEEAQRDGFIAEISELVQRQLVTETLTGNFRNHLERMMEARAQRVGMDGARVQQYVQNLQQSSHHTRNDFSELGIIPPDQQQALSDDISVVSATAAVTVNNAQQNAAMSREMASLKAQLAEMKNMMKLSFDLQLDTQRAIRQEVAAALAQALGTDGAAVSTSAPTRGTAPVDDAHCLICLDKNADSVLYQCGHLCVCHGCGIQLKQRGHHCPVCRAPIRDIIRAYKSGAKH